MDKKEFAKLKVGDKVRIVAKVPKNCFEGLWNSKGGMDKWLGKIMTVRMVPFGQCWVKMKEDYDEFGGGGWFWHPELVECKIPDAQPTIIEHLVKDRKTIVKLSNGKVGVATCSPEDEFDIYEGLRIATARAYGKEPTFTKDEPKVKGSKRQAKVGEYIKVVDAFCSSGCYKNGDILKVYKQGHYANMVFCETSKKTTDGITDNGNPSIWGFEYVVLEGYKPEPKVKEVKRVAKPGEYIKIVHTCMSCDKYQVGDIFKVDKVAIGGSLGTVYVNSIRSRVTNSDYPIWQSEYVVLEGYTPKKK